MKSNQTRRNDFPELQVGYPERNDVKSPELEMERVHVDLENMQISRASAKELNRVIKERGTATSEK